MRKTVMVLIFGLVNVMGFSQITNYQGSILSAGGSYLELKDELNHGLVFRGPDIRLSYGYKIIDSSRYFSYQLSLDGGGKTTRGTWGFMWYLSPLDLHYSWSIGSIQSCKIYLGPSFRVQYKIQNYPELHAGPVSWFTICKYA